MSRPTALITNDDGIDSAFLHALAAAHADHFDVFVVAPKEEQSWAGRSFSRHRDVAVERRPDLPWPAWSVDGTPSDCVNLAFGHLLDTPVDICVSGINVGFNVTLPLVMTSGTVAAALEGSLWGCRSVAYSQAVDRRYFDRVKETKGHLEGEVAVARDLAAGHAGRLSKALMAEPAVNGVVHNVNFPSRLTADTATEKTGLGQMRLGCLFARKGEGYAFAFPSDPRPIGTSEATDSDCLKRGVISHTILDYRNISRSL
ncbi:MAG: 5'/3'-nucleotidase SurE [Myxococcota bacterium]|nr:5'/3'-nucleotidase SurE [Myxococcota bacterium]